MEVTNRVSVTLLGNSGVGKTSLCIRYYRDEFPYPPYVPCVMDTASKEITVHGVPVEILCCEVHVAGEDCERLWPVTYNFVDACILCFSLVDPHSYENC